MVQERLRALQTLVVGVMVIGGALSAYAQKTYYINEQLDFTGNGCATLEDLNDVTSALQVALNADRWSGRRFTDASAWPQDFLESCSIMYGIGGLDSSFADASTLAVFSGHGSPDTLRFGTARNEVCNISFSASIRLGSMAGARAAYGMWLGSNIMQGFENGLNAQWVRQHFGFLNSPVIFSTQPRDFYLATYSTANSDAWLDVMRQSRGLVNRPIVVSYGANEPGCWSLHNSAKLKGDVWVRARVPAGASCGQPQPAGWYCSESF